jgi:hypothetical protein
MRCMRAIVCHHATITQRAQGMAACDGLVTLPSPDALQALQRLRVP